MCQRAHSVMVSRNPVKTHRRCYQFGSMRLCLSTKYHFDVRGRLMARLPDAHADCQFLHGPQVETLTRLPHYLGGMLLGDVLFSPNWCIDSYLSTILCTCAELHRRRLLVNALARDHGDTSLGYLFPVKFPIGHMFFLLINLLFNRHYGRVPGSYAGDSALPIV
jgi:hypothetical protein